MARKRKFKWIALKLVVIMFFIFLLQLIFKEITENFMLVSSDILTRPWILLTSIFLHGGWVHLLYNSFALFLFGSFLEKRIGSSNFLAVFLITGLIASLISSIFYDKALGASGAIYGIIGMLVILSPLMPVITFGVPMPLILASLFWIFIDFAGFSSFLRGMPTSIANAAHLSGFLSGILLGIIFNKTKRRRKWRWKIRKRSKGL